MKDLLQRVVAHTYTLTTSGPDGEVKRIATFVQGEKLSLRKISETRAYPDEYEIHGQPGMSFSRGVLNSFLPGFELSTTASMVR